MDSSHRLARPTTDGRGSGTPVGPGPAEPPVREIGRCDVLSVIDAVLAYERRSGPSANAARQISPSSNASGPRLTSSSHRDRAADRAPSLLLARAQAATCSLRSWHSTSARCAMWWQSPTEGTSPAAYPEGVPGVPSEGGPTPARDELHGPLRRGTSTKGRNTIPAGRTKLVASPRTSRTQLAPPPPAFAEMLDPCLTPDRNSRHQSGPRRAELGSSTGVREVELGGLEPPTSWVRSRRSPN